MPFPTDADASAVSFAHLSGIALPASGARAESDKDEDKDREDENTDEDAEDEDDKKSKKAKKAKAKADEDDDGSDADMSDEDEDEDDKPKDKAKSARTAERARWAAVLGNKSFARAPALGARLLATTGMSAKAIVGLLAEAPAAVASGQASSARSDRNPALGQGSPSRGAPTESHMVSAMQRAREAASRTGNRR